MDLEEQNTKEIGNTVKLVELVEGKGRNFLNIGVDSAMPYLCKIFYPS